MRSLISQNRRQSILRASLLSSSAIFAFTETWLTSDVLDGELGFQDFNMYRKDRKESGVSNHGGVMLAVKKEITSCHLQEFQEMKDIVACFIGCTKTIVIICFYNPPENSNYRWSLSKWKMFVDKCKPFENKYLYLLGDINFKYTDWATLTSSDEYEHSVLELLSNINCRQLVEIPT